MPRNMLAGAAVAVVAIVAVGLGGWYFFIRGDEPPPVSLADAVASVATATATSAGDTSTANTATATTTSAATAAATSEAGGAAEGDLTGAWTVDSANSFVGYRIDEELAQIGSTTAVGRTSDVTGTLEFDGSTITAVSVTANLQTLQSDDDRRDGQLRRQALETNQFPEATFILVEPIAIEGDPASGEPITATAVGDLTLHGVTNRVELTLQGQLVDGQVIVVGSTDILLADYDIEQPQSIAVLSVSEQGTMEMQLVFVRA
ncbi:MAG: YceI family protein [Dehalococcoidia bacterium]